MCFRWGVLCLFPSDKRVARCSNARNNTIEGEVHTTEIKGCKCRNIFLMQRTAGQRLSAEVTVSLGGELRNNARRLKDLLVGT